jgi:3D (Asp-Asp-Asp) domain-containing protein
MKKLKKNVAGVIVVSMLVGSNVVSLAAYDKQINKINEYKEVNKNRIKQLEENNQSLRDEVFDKNSQLHNQQGEIEEYKLDIKEQKAKNGDLKKKLEEAKKSVKSRPSKPTHQVQVSRGETNSKKSYQMQMTSYTAFCNTGCTGVTATGVDVSNSTTYQGYKVIAVDPSVIPLYSIVRVDTVNESFQAVAMDTGGAIKGNIIDLLVGSKSKARDNGRQYVTVTVLREGK